MSRASLYNTGVGLAAYLCPAPGEAYLSHDQARRISVPVDHRSGTTGQRRRGTSVQLLPHFEAQAQGPTPALPRRDLGQHKEDKRRKPPANKDQMCWQIYFLAKHMAARPHDGTCEACFKRAYVASGKVGMSYRYWETLFYHKRDLSSIGWNRLWDGEWVEGEIMKLMSLSRWWCMSSCSSVTYELAAAFLCRDAGDDRPPNAQFELTSEQGSS
ncbi:hypothetical protein IAR55_005506 [Kwoniella newhampshirensis]|uniref:Uncharacterized protein n=1 Tax=Kwoniella newhampshirensis TaxID=1651941 RepID=A0AAW0YWB6_9TREE